MENKNKANLCYLISNASKITLKTRKRSLVVIKKSDEQKRNLVECNECGC